MNELVIFSLVNLTIIRLVGFGISLHYYFETKRKAHIYFMIGWLVFSLAPIPPIFSGLTNEVYLSQMFLLLNGILVSVGFLYITSGYFSYFIKIPKIIFLILTPIFISLPIILYFGLGIKIALNCSIFTYNAFLMGAFIIPVLKWENFKETVSKSIGLYFINLGILLIFIPISLFNILQGYSYGLYESNDVFLISINYTFGIISMILMIIYFLHLELTISNREKGNLKDKYSHNLGNILQTVYLSIGLLKQKKEIDLKERIDLVELIEKKINQAEKFLNEIRII
ncbi:MAG: hypothetical protein EAX96_19520 [Candidatus Lokiarchaeota archaeon]|nr:hypothetical protein [Candidatus Lokiarchaeota archaeon]